AALLQLGHVFVDGIVEHDLALLHRLRQQGRYEHLGDGGEIEQHIRGDRLLARDVGHAVVEEQGAVATTAMPPAAMSIGCTCWRTICPPSASSARAAAAGIIAAASAAAVTAAAITRIVPSRRLGRMALPLNVAWTGLLRL